MLARRLINQQSVSIDAEEFMVTKLKVRNSLDGEIENECRYFI